VPSLWGHNHRRPALATAPAGLLVGIQRGQDPGANGSNECAMWHFWMCQFAAGGARMTLNDARSATLQCSRCTRRVLSDQALDRPMFGRLATRRSR
jgi:hypothetical protein